MSQRVPKDPVLHSDSAAGWRSLFVGQGPEPPYFILIAITLIGGAVALGGALAIGATGGMRLSWVFVGGSWVTRSQVGRWWAFRHHYRSLSWQPTATFAACSAVIGYVIAAVAFHPHDRAFVIYVALLTGWFGGDARDWLQRRNQTPAIASE